MKFICTVFLVAYTANVLQAQPLLKATVLNQQNSYPIAGATIAINQKAVAITNEDGGFTLGAKNNATAKKIAITAIGFEAFDTILNTINGHTVFYLKPIALLLQPVEVYATRAGEKSPFAKTNLNKNFIEKNNLGQDLPYLLNQTPGVVINTDAGNGIGYTGIRIRGTDATRINVTINGIPYNDAESQGTFFVDLPDFASSLGSIQIQRGVGTSSNGAGAFGASINLSSNEYNATPHIAFNNTIGSFGTLKNTVKLGSGLLAKHFTLDGRFSNIRSNGYIDRANSKLQSSYLSAAYFGKKTAIRLNAIIGKEKTYQAYYGISEADLKTKRTFNSAGTEKPGEPYANQTDNYLQNHFQLFWNQELGKNWNFNTAFFFTKGYGNYEQYKANQTLATYGIANIIHGADTIKQTDLVRRLWLNNDYYGQVFSFNHKKQTYGISLGGGWSRYNGNHYGDVIYTKANPSANSIYYNLYAYKTDLNLYAKWQQQLGKRLLLFTDLQYRQVQYDIYGFRSNPNLVINSNYHFTNPKVGLSYQQQQWSGFISYAQANKEPNREDYETGLLLKPASEQLHDIELQGKKQNALPGLDITATAYYMFYKNQLILTGKINDVGAYTRSNVPNSYRLGAEVEANYKSNFFNGNYSLAVSQNKIKNFTEYVDDYDNGGQQIVEHNNTNIALSPAIVQSLTLTILPVKNLELSLLSKQVSKQYLDNTSSTNRSLKPFLVNDFRATYTLQTKAIKQISVVAQLNNLFDVKYEPNGYTFSYITGGAYQFENYYFPVAGIHFLLGLHVNF